MVWIFSITLLILKKTIPPQEQVRVE